MLNDVTADEAWIGVRPNGKDEACNYRITRRIASPPKPLATAGDNVLCVIDGMVAGYADRLINDDWFGGAKVHRLVLDQPAKTLTNADRIWSTAMAAKATLCVAVGGGTVCDLVGFTASCLYRGTPMVFFPTTTLAMMDAVLSGKTGLDYAGIKNAVGSIHYPRQVFCHLDVLATLTAEHLVSGFAESVKIAVTSSLPFFESLETWVREGGPLKREVMPIILESCRLKAALVAAPPEVRKHSLYGHVLGHAMESLGGAGARHGDCVSLGLLCEGWLAVRRGYWSEEEWRRQFHLLRGLGLPVTLPRVPEPDEVLQQAANDKYCRGNHLAMVLPSAIGKVHSPDERAWTMVPLDEARSAYCESLEILESLVSP